MNKKITIIFTIILLIIAFFLFQKYVPYNMEVRDKIIPPENNKISIEGIWEVKKISIFNNSYNKEDVDNFKVDNLIGEKAAFNNQYVFLIDELSVNPQYKVKNVNIKDYFSYIYKINIEDIGLKNSNISKTEIISVISDGKLFYEFIKLDDSNLIVQREGVFFYLEKIEEDTEKFFSESNLKKLKIKEDTKKLEEDKLLRSGVLIGIRDDSLVKDTNGIGSQGSNYRTIWIPVKNRKVLDVVQVKDLFLPKIDGFWRVGVQRHIIRENSFKDEIFAYNNQEENNTVSIDDKNELNIHKKIIFAGNDYLCMEYSKIQGDKSKDFYKVLPIHAVKNIRGVKISDIFGEDGKKAIKSSLEAFLASQDKTSIKNIEKEANEENFSLVRNNGYWIVKGRLNEKDPTGYDYKDYNININPSNKMVNFNAFYLSWNAVKSRVPDAIDAYTSPNKDVALIVTKDNIKIYEIKDNELGNKAIYKISIKKDESIVMAEWATGDYVEKWNKEIGSK
ncbi:hypothetical protein [Clostridium cochlearium]|uniref:Putative lipoprotein n=1 Tax=Clostridium cochlearium TaxID=1494 RepID=A0A240AMF7_CLOCO|nr:hypothetical protein [Clostridium cochlearium]MBE6064540.1 hypothetical protein [Clostridium cochlearium]MBU5270172.1 hypothetical protein [Clostridium cochlearium]MDU1441886.1 hypothetical protein [Clostridium cochlearium]SNV84048.1 putative lipoprotein [Clostridium cochlearium]SQB35235.1 putative lipoprotein [Clostridium cochlearium]